MATSTPNYGLYKYGGDDSPDLTKLGPTMDKIDAGMKANADNIGLLTARDLTFVAATISELVNQLIDHYNAIPAGNCLINGGWSGNYYFGGSIHKISATAGVIIVVPASSAEAWKIVNNGAGWAQSSTI